MSEPDPSDAPFEKKRLTFMAVVLFGLLIVTSFVCGYILLARPLSEHIWGSASEEIDVGIMHEFGEFIVNVGTREPLGIARVVIVFELDAPGIQPELANREPQLRSRIQQFLRREVAEAAVEEEGIRRLEQELLTLVNSLLSAGELRNVYVTDLLVQY